MKYLILILALCASCVMPGDIRNLQANYDELQAGVVTLPEFEERNAEIMDEIDERNEALASEGTKVPTDPLGLLLWGGSMAATIFGTNKLRDRRRAMGTDVKKSTPV